MSKALNFFSQKLYPKRYFGIKVSLTLLLFAGSMFRTIRIEEVESEFAKWLIVHQAALYINAISGLLLILLEAFSYFASLDKVSFDGYKALVHAFNRIVTEKQNTFNKAIYEKSTPLCTSITQPTKQLQVIVTQICNVMTNLTNHDVKVALCPYVDGIAKTSDLTIDQNNDRVSVGDDGILGNAFFDHVAKQRCTCIIPDLEANFRTRGTPYKYIDGMMTKGSIIGYSIKGSGGKVKFVLTVKSDAKIFHLKSQSKYDTIFKWFAQRIILESSLSEIRNSYMECSARNGNALVNMDTPQPIPA